MNTANINPTTGIRYGVIALNNIDQDTADELMFGCDATNVSEEEAIEEIEAEAKSEAKFLGLDGTDAEDHIERAKENADLDIDEPHITGTLEGVKYEISWLGGAPLLWIIEGPTGFASRLCSPCVPNAADLDGGFSSTEDEAGTYPYTCYILPADWMPRLPPAPVDWPINPANSEGEPQ